jgi:hypothetical protein
MTQAPIQGGDQYAWGGGHPGKMFIFGPKQQLSNMKPWLAIILVVLFALLLTGCRAFDCGCPMH